MAGDVSPLRRLCCVRFTSESGYDMGCTRSAINGHLFIRFGGDCGNVRVTGRWGLL
jgi:hypothetical protein